MSRASRSVVGLLAAVAGLSCTSQALAATFYVSSEMKGTSGLSPNDALSSIKAALTKAQAMTGPHVIIVGPGTYSDELNLTGSPSITLIADTTATSWESVSGYKGMTSPGARSVTITGSVAISGSSTRRFIGFNFSVPKSPVTITGSPTVVFEDCGFVDLAYHGIEFTGAAKLTVRRCNFESSNHGIVGSGKSLAGATLNVVGSKFFASDTAINIEGLGAVSLTVSRSYFANGSKGISARNGTVDVSASIFSAISTAAVWQESTDAKSSITANANTFFDTAACIDGSSLSSYTASNELEISISNCLVAYSGSLVVDDGKGLIFTAKSNLEWLSRNDPDTEQQVKKFGSVGACLPGFVNADALDLRLSADATDALGQADGSTTLDFYGQARSTNQSSDIGAVDRRPIDAKVLAFMNDWSTYMVEYGHVSLTSHTIMDLPPVEMYLSPSSTKLDWLDLVAVLQDGYSEDSGAYGMKLSHASSFSRPNYSATSKALGHHVNGWFDPSSTQQFVFDPGAADVGSQLKFDLWVADATDSPAVVTIKVNGLPVWRHTVLAGTGTNAPPLAGWSLPMYPTQATGSVTGDATKNDLGFIGVTVPAIYKYMSTSDGKTPDIVEFSVDNCFAWALGNVQMLPHDEMIKTNPPFRDVTLETSTGYFPATDTKATIPATYRGILLADTRGEGKLDIIQANSNTGATRYSIAEPGSSGFANTKVPAGASIATLQAFVQDADNDGTLEMVEVGETSTRVTNLTSSAFASKTKAHAFIAATGTPRAAAVFDANGDGWCDVFHAFTGGNTILGGSGTISNASQSFSAFIENAIVPNTSSDYGKGNFVSIADINHDGTPDIFYPLGSGRLWLSAYDASTSTMSYTHVSRGISVSIDPDLPTGMAWGDYDNDGDLDLFVPSRTSHAQLWKNPGNAMGNFTNVATTVGLASSNLAMSVASKGASAAWGDYDNDGDLDLVMTTGNAGAPDAIRLFLNSGAPSYTFTRLRDFGGDATTEGGDVRFVDYDNNGYLDIVVTSDTDKFPTRLFRNELRDNTPAGEPYDQFLKVRVLGRGAGGLNAAAIGARVELRNASDESLVARRDVGLTQGLGGMDPLWVHFGGVDTSKKYIVRVYGPTGYRFETTVIPASASTTIGSTTIAQMVTVDEKALRPGFNIRSYTEVAPDDEVEVDGGGGKK